MKRGRPRQPEPDAGITGTMLQRARSISLNPILETPFGQLAFLGEFTQYQIETAEKIQQIYRDFHAQLGMKPWVASPSFEVGQGLSPVWEDDDGRERAERVKQDFNRLCDTLDRCPVPALRAMEELIIRQKCCPPGRLDDVRRLLDAVAIEFGYKVRKKALTLQGQKAKSAASPTRY